jgi:hypothetical protein
MAQGQGRDKGDGVEELIRFSRASDLIRPLDPHEIMYLGDAFGGLFPHAAQAFLTARPRSSPQPPAAGSGRGSGYGSPAKPLIARKRLHFAAQPPAEIDEMPRRDPE